MLLPHRPTGALRRLTLRIAVPAGLVVALVVGGPGPLPAQAAPQAQRPGGAPAVDLAVASFTAAPATVAPGGTAVFTAVVGNTGPNAAIAGATLSISVPRGATVASVGAQCRTGGATGPITCALPPLAVGATATFTFSLTVTLTAPSPLCAIAQLLPGPNMDLTTTNNSGQACVTRTGSATPTPPTPAPGGADLQIVAGGTAQMLPGTTLTTSFTVTNVGTANTRGTVTVTVPLPATLTGATVSGSGWTCAVVATVATCATQSRLNGGQSYPPITITGTATGCAPITLTGTVAPTDATPANNTSSITTTLGCAQLGWVRQFGTTDNDEATGVAVAPDGSIMAVGTTSGSLPGFTSAGSRDAYVRTYDAAGTERWTRQFGTDGDEFAFGVAAGPDGTVYIAGRTSGAFPGLSTAGDYDAFVRAYDAQGTERWTRQFGTAADDLAQGVAVAPDGSIIVVGYTQGSFPGLTNAGGFDAFLRAYDATGTERWTRQFGTDGDEFAFGVAAGPDGSIYVVGFTTRSFPGFTLLGGFDAFIRAYDAQGIERWTRQFGTVSDEFAIAVAMGADGSIYVAGYILGSFPGFTNAGNQDAYVRIYDAQGIERWTRQFGTVGTDLAVGVAAGPDGSIIVVGFTQGSFPGYTNAGGFDGYARAYNAQGTERWTRQFGTADDDFPSRVAPGRDGSVYIAGRTSGSFPGFTNAGHEDAFVVQVVVGVPAQGRGTIEVCGGVPALTSICSSRRPNP
jgi:hypothetical protein